jgi:hypothetical protein
LTSDRDVWRAASTLVDIHGEDAPFYALQSIDQRLERGDFRGAEQWRRVQQAVLELLRRDPIAGRLIN